jgi:hypothetical protein
VYLCQSGLEKMSGMPAADANGFWLTKAIAK